MNIIRRINDSPRAVTEKATERFAADAMTDVIRILQTRANTPGSLPGLMRRDYVHGGEAQIAA